MSRNFMRKHLILSAVSAMTLPMGSMVFAADEAGNEMAVEEIVVSSSRIKKPKFEAPTPVTVLGLNDMEARGITNIADILNELPGFSGTRTPSSTVLNSWGNGTNVVDLRGLGGNRNLILVNGRRHVLSDEFGNVDLNIIPTLAVIHVIVDGKIVVKDEALQDGVISLANRSRQKAVRQQGLNYG